MKNKQLQDILAQFPGKRVLIVGDVMLDEYLWGEMHRISPEAPVPVVEFRECIYRPGGAANTAVNITSLGGQAILGGVVGEDEQAKILWERLSRCGVKMYELFPDFSRPTTTKTRLIAHSQQVVRIDREERHSLSPEMEDKLLKWIKDRIKKADACLLSDYAKGVLTSRIIEETIQFAQQAHKPLVVDPKGLDYSKYSGATVVTPNLQEAKLVLAHIPNPPQGVWEIGQQLLALLEGSAILITRGSEGMSLFKPGQEEVHIPAVPLHVYDVTGAGDTVAATLTLALAAGATLEWGARLANVAASIVISKVGTATVSLEELRADANRWL